ncbi:MAG: preprotein translocase subunit SecE [Gammaproteobacteria bacterium]
MQNYFLWIVGLLLIGVAVYGNSYFALQPLLYRVIGVLVIFTISLLVLLRTKEGKEAFALILDSRKEIRRVVWPTRTETTQTTLIVIAAVTFMGLVLWGLDSFFGWIISNILG